MRNLLNINRLVAALIFITGFGLIINLIKPEFWSFQNFWFGVKFFIFIFELIFLLIGYGIARLLGALFPSLGYGDPEAVAVMTAIHNALFGGNDTVLGRDIVEWIENPLYLPENAIDGIYTFTIIMILIIAFIAGIGFLRDCNPALSATSFFGLNIAIGIIAIYDMLKVSLDFSTENLVSLIFSRLTISAFLIYLYLELSFQASYIYNVIGPNIQRHRRISSNLKRLRDFRMPITREPATEIKDEGKIEMRGKNTSAARLAVTTAFSRIRGMVGKKLFKISTEEDWDKLNNRLKNFYEQLERNDPLISVSLSASASTPSITRLIVIISTGTLFRMGMLVILSWLALNPIPVLRFINMPQSVIDSVEAGQPEMIMFVLAPLSILFIIIGLIVQLIQKRITKRMEKTTGKVIHPVSEDKEEKPKRTRRRRREPQRS
jgi:hypothetical protein